MPTVPDHPGWDRGELGPGTWYAADGHTAEDLPLAVTDGKFQDPILWPVLSTGLSAKATFDYPDYAEPLDRWTWPARASRRVRLRLPRNLEGHVLVECLRDDQRHALAYDDADHTVRAFLPQVTVPAQDGPDWLWLDVESPGDGADPCTVWATGTIHRPEEAEA